MARITTNKYMIGEINVFSVFPNTVNSVIDDTDIMSPGILFLRFGPAEANDRLPIVTRHDERTVHSFTVAILFE